MKMRYNHIIPRLLKVGAITLYPWVLFAQKRPSNRLIKHELIHVYQVREKGWLRFYLSYLWEYLLGRLRGLSHDDAYHAISYEVEAYEKQSKPLTKKEREMIKNA